MHVISLAWHEEHLLALAGGHASCPHTAAHDAAQGAQHVGAARQLSA